MVNLEECILLLWEVGAIAKQGDKFDMHAKEVHNALIDLLIVNKDQFVPSIDYNVQMSSYFFPSCDD